MKPSGVFQEVDDFFHFFFGFVATSYVGKSNLIGVFIEHAGFAFAKAKGTAFAAALHLAHEINPHTNQQEHGAPADQQTHEQGTLFARFHIKFHAIGNEVANQATV